VASTLALTSSKLAWEAKTTKGVILWGQFCILFC